MRLVYALGLILALRTNCGTTPDSDACVPSPSAPPCPPGASCSASDTLVVPANGLNAERFARAYTSGSPLVLRSGSQGAAVLMRVDETALRRAARARAVHHAVLRFEVSQAATYEGPSCAIQLHPMRSEWDVRSATWVCSTDPTPEADSADCEDSQRWTPDAQEPSQRPWDVSQTIATVSPCNPPCASMPEPRAIELDVTADVAGIVEGNPHLGWALTRDSVENLQVAFSDPPRLVIKWREANTGAPPPSALPVDAPTTIGDLAGHLDQANNMDPTRLGVIRGRVRDAAGNAVANVAVRVLHGEDASPPTPLVYTRADGIFDLPVEGGGAVTIEYRDSTDAARPTTPAAPRGHISIQRTVDVPVREYLWAPDVALREYDEASAPVLFGGEQGTATAVTITGRLREDQDPARTGATWQRRPRLFLGRGTVVRPASSPVQGAPYNSLALSLTEFTVNEASSGVRGPEFMPGTLPPSSAYTLALEFAAFDPAAPGTPVDIAFSAAPGAESNGGAVFCIESLPSVSTLGAVVPVGSYDREQGHWVAESNGRVLAVTTTATGITYDFGGEPAPAMLSQLGITPAMQPHMRAAYAPAAGQTSRTTTLWCHPVAHFSSWDQNFAARFPPGFFGPVLRKGTVRLQDPCRRGGSIIECDNQALGEELGVVGTPYALHYQSDRTRARVDAYRVQFPLWPESGVHPQMREVSVEIQVAGRRYERVVRQFIPANRIFTWVWDGLDGYGRPVEGAQNATIRVGYGYLGEYVGTTPSEPGAFGSFESESRTFGVARELLYVYETRREPIGLLSARSAGLGGWTIDAHHAYDPVSSTLYLGDGQRRQAETLGRIVRTVAGGGSGGTGEGPALERQLLSVYGIAVRRDGVVYFSHGGTSVRRLVPGAGGALTIENVLPGTAGTPSGSGFAPHGIAFGPDDTLYIADQANGRVLSVPARCLETPAPSGCGAPTTVLELEGTVPEGLAVSSGGMVYVSSPTRNVVYQARPTASGFSARIVAGRNEGTGGFAGDGDLPSAGTSRLDGPRGLAVMRDGSVLIADAGNCRVRRLSTTGVLTTVAGNGCGGTVPAEGAAATSGGFSTVTSVAVDRAGGFFFAGRDNGARDRIWRVAADGTFATIARNTNVAAVPPYGDGRLATEAYYGGINSIALDPNGALYLADSAINRIRRIAPALPNVPLDSYVIPSESGGVLYEFDARGQHVNTKNALTGQVLVEFGYTTGLPGAPRFLASVTDRRLGLQRTTRVVRAGDALTSVVAPTGQTTSLTGTSLGDLTRVEPPHGTGPVEPWAFGYTGDDGLLASMTEPTGAMHQYGFDALGRLIRDADGAGAAQSLARVDTEHTAGGIPLQERVVTLRSPMGRTTSFRAAQREDGLSERATTDPAAQTTTGVRDDEGTLRYTLADGTVVTQRTAADPRLGGASRYVSEATVQLPGTSTPITSTANRAITLLPGQTDPTSPEAWATLRETNVVAGRTYVVELSRTSATGPITVTATSPMGRLRRTVVDRDGRLVSATVTGANSASGPIEATYVEESQSSMMERALRSVEGVRRGPSPVQNQSTRMEWLPSFGTANPAAGWLDSITGPEGHRTRFAYDPVGRLTDVELPDSQHVGQSFAFTPTGGDTRFTHSFSPPGRGAYRARYDVRSLLRQEQPPAVTGGGAENNATLIDYDLDGAPTRVTRPDGTLATLTYEPATGRLQQFAVPGAALTYSYGGPAGGLSAIERSSSTAPNDGSRLTVAYNAQAVPSNVSWGAPSGVTAVVSGFVEQQYDALLVPTQVTVGAGGRSDHYRVRFDEDGLLTCAGASLASAPTSCDGGLRYEYDSEVESVPRTQDRGILRRISTGSTANPGVVSNWQYNRELDQLDYEQTFAFRSGSPFVVYRADYLRDRLGRITRHFETMEAVGGGQGPVLRRWYCYDAAGRLRGEYANFQQDIDCANMATQFSYDANGNPTQLDDGATTYDEHDRLRSAGTTQYTYFANGQRATRVRNPAGMASETTRYLYDGFGTLRRVERPSGAPAIEYVTDPVGRRIARRVGATVTQKLLYLDGLRPAAELDVTTGRVKRMFVYGSRASLPDQVVVYDAAGTPTRYRMVSDHLGSPRLAVNADTGVVVARWRYDVWGRELESPASEEWKALPFGFAGGLFDRDTGLVRFGARDYDPATRQWLERDPSGFSGGLNLYEYAGGDPVNYVDPSGRIGVLALVGPAALAGAFQLLLELHDSRGNLGCIRWGYVLTAALGAALIEAVVTTGFLELALGGIFRAATLTRGPGRLITPRSPPAAGQVVEGTGTRVVFEGHGALYPGSGGIVPEGTLVRIPRPLDSTRAPRFLSEAETQAIAEAGEFPPGIPSTIFGPGDELPNLVLLPIEEIEGEVQVGVNSWRVNSPTYLRDLITEDMGYCLWAACSL